MLTQQYADGKTNNGMVGKVPLGRLLQFASMAAESYAQIDKMAQFCASVERRLAKCLKSNMFSDADLVEAIGKAKIRAIDVSI